VRPAVDVTARIKRAQAVHGLISEYRRVAYVTGKHQLSGHGHVLGTGPGRVSCEIQVDGKAISTAQAAGGYNIAYCEIDQNPVTGKWETLTG
jgi:hypothetical protein